MPMRLSGKKVSEKIYKTGTKILFLFLLSLGKIPRYKLQGLKEKLELIPVTFL